MLMAVIVSVSLPSQVFVERDKRRPAGYVNESYCEYSRIYMREFLVSAE